MMLKMMMVYLRCPGGVCGETEDMRDNNNNYYDTMTMMMTMTLCGGGCGEAEDMRDAFEVSSISSNSDQNTALNSETIHC